MKLTPEIISKAQLNDWDFVFLINNPVTAIISKMIIELEMLHGKKTLVGPLTSVKKYAEAFGSTFKDVELY